MEKTKKKMNGFCSVMITGAAILLVLKVLLGAINTDSRDAVQGYYVMVVLMYFVMAIFLMALFINIKEARGRDQVYGYVAIGICLILTYQLFVNFENISSMIKVLSSSDGFYGYMNDADDLYDFYERGSNVLSIHGSATEVLGIVNWWCILTVGQAIMHFVSNGNVTLPKAPDVSKLSSESLGEFGKTMGLKKEEKLAIRVNGMDINIDDEILVGSDLECNLVLESEYMSAKHAVIKKRGKEYCICDLYSSNHTYLNDVEIPAMEEKTISKGDKVRFANITVEIVEQEESV